MGIVSDRTDGERSSMCAYERGRNGARSDTGNRSEIDKIIIGSQKRSPQPANSRKVSLMNPYTDVNFFEFFWVLGKRIWQFATGGGTSLATDEIQLGVLACCSIACGLLVPFIVLKRMSMFANSLSHTTLLGIAGAFLFASYWWGSGMTDLSTLLMGALLSAILTAGLTEILSRVFRLAPDASIGLSFTTLFAIGVILVSVFTRDAHLSTEAVTGNCDALQ